MFQFDRLTKKDARATNDLAMPVAKDDRHPDGRFKMGPANTEKKRGEGAFQSAHGHIDDAADSAIAGDAEGANFHLSMANQYAGVGVQNHLMSNYAKQTKGAPLSEAAGAGAAKKSDDERIRKDGEFWSGDAGGKDAGAAKSVAPQIAATPSVSAHLQNIVDRHETEGGLHDQISRNLDNVGMIKRAGEHRTIAAEHNLAAGHYRAAAGAAENTSDNEGLARHLKAARDSAGHAAELTKCMA
jgi:hypothetical protein